MTTINTRKLNVVSVEQGDLVARSAKLNVYVVEQPTAQIVARKLNVIAVEQPIGNARVLKTSVVVVEQLPPDMYYRRSDAFPPFWWFITPYVNRGAFRGTEAGVDRRVTEAGDRRLISGPLAAFPTWEVPIATYVRHGGVWRYVRHPTSPFNAPP